MSLYRLAYNSKVAKVLLKDDLRQILAKSAVNNQRDGLTGALVFSHGVFLQVLEGRREALNITFRRLWSDPRHSDISLIGIEPIAARAFTNWSMAYIDDAKATKALLLKHCGADKLVADYLSLPAAVAFVLETLA